MEKDFNKNYKTNNMLIDVDAYKKMNEMGQMSNENYQTKFQMQERVHN